MTQEISLAISLSRKDDTQLANRHIFETYLWQLDQTLKRHVDNIYSIGTSEESYTWSDITTPGLLLMINHATANYVEWGVATTDYAGKMLFGEPAGPFRLNAGKTLYLKSNTAASDVRIILYGG